MAALARQIVTVAHATTTYAEVAALEAWMGAHVRYSTDIPPLLPGQDAVNQFLFGTRVGFCEQISTALAVMLRTLGVPTREAIGYVPGPFDPLSDLYEIQAKDAHAWVQVWFPGVGWQSFDPTAHVPLAPPDPGAVLLSDIGHGIARLPWAPIGRARCGRSLPARRFGSPAPSWPAAGWVDQVTAELEEPRRRGRSTSRWQPAETLDEYASRLTKSGRWQSGAGSPGQLVSATAQLERIAYGGQEPDAPTRALVEAMVRGLRPALGLRRRGRATGSRQP